jgi:transcriptional regulator with XRE-family HTH domain
MTTTLNPDFGASLRKARRRRGLSQKALAQMLGIHTPQVSRWENHTDKPRRTTVVRLAEALDIDPKDLAGVDDMGIATAGTLGQRMKFLRTNRGWTLRDVANRLGVSHVTVTQWENSVCNPKVGKLREIATLFEVSTDTLLLGRP